jgi:hypothetical protein
MVFVSCEVGTKGYCTYDPHTGHVHITYDAIFDELTQWDWSRDAAVNGDTEHFKFMVTMTYLEQDADQAEPTLTGATPGSWEPPPPPPPMSQGPPPTQQTAKFASPPSIEPDLNADHDEEELLRFHGMDNVLGPATVWDPLWHMAMAEELHSIEENKTWDVVDLPVYHHRSTSSGCLKQRRMRAGVSSSTRLSSSPRAMCRG